MSKLDLKALLNKAGQKRPRAEEPPVKRDFNTKGAPYYQTVCQQLELIHRFVHSQHNVDQVSDAVLNQIEIEVWNNFLFFNLSSLISLKCVFSFITRYE